MQCRSYHSLTPVCRRTSLLREQKWSRAFALRSFCDSVCPSFRTPHHPYRPRSPSPAIPRRRPRRRSIKMADKEATVYIVDMGMSMGEKRNARKESDLDWAMTYVWEKITSTVSVWRTAPRDSILQLIDSHRPKDCPAGSHWAAH